MPDRRICFGKGAYMSIALKYYPRLYLGDSIDADKLDKIKKKLENRPLFSGVFLVAVSRNPSDQLEIYGAKQLAQSYYRKNPPYVVGLAGDYEEAVSLVIRMTEECLASRGDCRLKEYLQCWT